MNIAVIFAGGTGQRMNSRTKPKQFLLVHGKPIIIYTLEAFDQHPDIDAIVVVCLKEYIDVLEQLITKFGVGKIAAIVPGGSSGQESIRNGVDKANRLYPADSVVIVHDGVRPLIDQQTITDCIVSVKKNGSAVHRRTRHRDHRAKRGRRDHQHHRPQTVPARPRPAVLPPRRAA